VAVEEDLYIGHQVSEARGYTYIRRIFRVTDLDPSDPATMVLRAINDPAIPDIGDKYPQVVIPGEFKKYERCIVTTRDAAPDGCNAARVIVNYTNEPSSVFDQEITDAQVSAGDPTPDVKQITVGLVSEQTTDDVNGLPMTLNAPADTNQESYRSTANIGRPLGTLVFERTETIPVTPYLRDAVGRINSASLGGGTYPIGTVKLDRLDSISSDNGTTWRTSYQFSYKPGGWIYTDIWRGDDGKPTPLAVPQEFDQWETYDFGVLGLDFSDGQTPI